MGRKQKNHHVRTRHDLSKKEKKRRKEIHLVGRAEDEGAAKNSDELNAGKTGPRKARPHEPSGERLKGDALANAPKVRNAKRRETSKNARETTRKKQNVDKKRSQKWLEWQEGKSQACGQKNIGVPGTKRGRGHDYETRSKKMSTKSYAVTLGDYAGEKRRRRA